jgi:digeranylgeranylglycerophospholipid reductase
MKDLDYDIVVVGGGPAGSTTAKFAAKGGARVLMIEKRQEIGVPVRCGEGIAKEGLDSVGIKASPEWVVMEMEGARIISPKGFTMLLSENVAGNEVGYNVRRDLFDKVLARDAANAGADIMVKTSAVDVIKKDGILKGVKAMHMGETFDISANIVVGADGFESQVGRWAGIDTTLKLSDINTCLQYVLVGVDVDKRYNDFYLGAERAPGGYAWVFPRSEDSANVGIGVNLKVLKDQIKTGALPSVPAGAKTYLDRFIQNLPGLAKGKPIAQIAGAVSCSLPLDEIHSDGIMLVGDAGRMIDPLSGGGVVPSCNAGKIAGEVAADAVKQNDYSEEFLKKYDVDWRASYENHMIRNWIAKEKLVTLSDDVFDKVLETLQDYEVEQLTTFGILNAVKAKHPELVKEFEDLLM